MQRTRTLLLITVILLTGIFSNTDLHSATDFRMGLGIPLTTIIGNQSKYFGWSPGLELIMDIQPRRDYSYYINIGYLSTTGKSQPSAPGSTILLQPSISDISFGGGAAYYPLLRKEGFTPVLAFETGYHIVSETVKVIDQLVGREDSFSNSILFQNISISIGAEFQMDPRTSLQARGRVNLNIPIGRPENVSIIYTDNSLNYLQFQILLAAQYRLSK